MQAAHINPEEAVKVHHTIQSQQSLGIHFGTFQLTDKAIDAPTKDLQKALDENHITAEDFWVLQNGETRRVR